MDKQKQIEEMTDYIFGNAITHDTQFKEDCRSIAIDFYNAGYRKIPENSVVLTREEYERLLKEETLCERLGNDVDVKLKYIYELEDKVAQERNETAEKFAVMLKGSLDISVEGYSTNEVINEIEDKIDEICKKIIGGISNVRNEQQSKGNINDEK